MRYNEPEILTSIFTKTSSLSQIQERINALSKLTYAVNELLPSPLKQQCRIANYRQGVLVIQVSSASWLTRLKYEQSNLLSTLRQKLLPSLSSIQYQIDPNMTVKVSQQVDSVKNVPILGVMTPESAMCLYALAESAPDSLKKQLIKLANHAK